jgi:plasmid stabilization system protein ParE
MKVILTENAEENLWQIYNYHADYSEDYADQFQATISDFISSTLAGQPKMGTLYNPEQEVYRIVYDRRYNIYYVIQDALYIVYILDGRILLNIELADPDAALPTIS